MRYLVTGADGFVGNYLCRQLARNNQVTGLSRRVNRPTNEGCEDLSNLEFHYADLTKKLAVPGQIDVIVHAAACNPGPGTGTADYVSGNVTATANVIDFAIKKNVSLVVYFSAISIYGVIRTDLVDEETAIQNPSPYGMTKYLGELLLNEVDELLPSVIFRFPVIVGPGMKTGWLFRTGGQIVDGQPVKIFNSGSPYNMVHISDVYDLVTLSAGQQRSGSSVFTVSCRDLLSIGQIVGAIKKHTGSKSQVQEELMDSHGFAISTGKVSRELGFQPKTALEILSSFLEESTPHTLTLTTPKMGGDR